VAQHDFEIMPIAEGLELRCRRRNKGTALAAVLAAEPATVPVAYIGDDRTDEDAFRVLLGRGLTVRIAGSPDPTIAVVEIPPVDGVIRFLGRWLAATSVQRGKSNSAGSTG
jgi:trehalose 6-phosphate phosphatase